MLQCVAQSAQNLINGSCVTRLIHMCDTTQSHVCHDFTCVTCLLSLAVGTWQFSRVSLLQSSLLQSSLLQSSVLQNDRACYRISKLATESTITNHYRAIFRECLLVLSKALYQKPLYAISPHMSTCTQSHHICLLVGTVALYIRNITTYDYLYYPKSIESALKNVW